MSRNEEILEKLKQGIAVRDLLPDDVIVIKELREDGNYIELTSSDENTNEQIEESVPFIFSVQIEGDKRILTVSPELCPKSVYDSMSKDEQSEYLIRNKSFELPDDTVLTLF